MKKLILLFVSFSVFVMTSCSSTYQNTNTPIQDTNTTRGAVTGAAAGALIGQAIGGDTEATLLGATIGSLLGYAIGKEMDRRDRERLNHTYEYGHSGRTVAWTNPDTGVAYRVTPNRASAGMGDYQVCRPARVEIVVDGRTERTFRTACRNNYGEWVLQ